MFFKKKKIMSDKAFDDQNAENENADNLSQENEATDETMTNEADEILAEDETNDIEVAHTDKLKIELDEAKDKYLRLAAEFDNFRRRTAKERIELTQTAGKDIIQSLLVVLDDSNRALKQMETATDVESVKGGILLVFNKLHNIMQQKGLKMMDSANQPFDADLHDAITEIPAPTEDMKDKIIDVVEPGYYLNDKLIRHAKVVVGK
jgi:molecular chaperone GrpE